MSNGKCEMINDKCKGYTLLELLTVLLIIGIMVTATAIAFYGDSGKNLECLPVISAMDQMKAIQDAIVKGFYPDIGWIPCAGEDPLFTTPYLCVEEKIDAVEGWNKYYSSGWRGPYIKAYTNLNATYFDPVSYPVDPDGNPVLLPAIATSWAEDCEKMARDVEAEGEDAASYEGYCREQDLTPEECAMEYRKGKYYQILKPAKKCIEWEQDRYGYSCKKEAWIIPKDSAYIVCRGLDCLPGYKKEDYSACESSCEATCQEKLQNACQSYCEQYPYWPGCIQDCCKDDYENVYNECLDGCYFECRGDIKNLKITDTHNPDYIDIGDDIVMFVFREGLRSPLEK